MGAPGFWDDQERAAGLSSEHSRLSRRLESYRRLTGDSEALGELLELAESDEEVGEVEQQVGAIRGELDRLQEAALFRGDYDGNDAVLTITAGAGGTDAQDWAEMLLRMYLRWASDRSFGAEMLEASPGEEAGLKSASVSISGENVYGILKAERGVHRLVRQSPFDQAHRRHTAFAQVVVSPLLPESAQVDIDEAELKRTEAIILSMTVQERRMPHIIDGSRRLRIAAGSGTSVQQVNQLLNARKRMQKMMKQMGKGKMPKLPPELMQAGLKR